MKKILLLGLVMGGCTYLSGAADFSKMSLSELNEALVAAVKKGSYSEAQKLIQAGASVNQELTYTKSNYDDYDSKITCTLIEYAAKNGYVEIVKDLAQKLKNNDINSALILASKEGHTDVVKELLKAKPKVDFINTALLAAAEEFPGMTIHGATGRLNRTALKDYLNVIKELIKAGGNVNHANEHGETALIKIVKNLLVTEAQKRDRAEIIQALLKAKANVNHADKLVDKNTALMIAIQNHDFDVVQMLLNAPGININYANNNGDTALIIALKSIQYTYVVGNKEQYNNCLNSQKIVEKLLQAPGVNPHHVNKKGDTAIKLLNDLKSRKF